MIKSLLLTRTHEENEFLKKYFKNKDININLISAPLLEIEFKKKLSPLTKYNIFIFTSSYAVKAIKNIKTLKKKYAFCVGSKTTSEAEKLGFIVFNAKGNSKDLLSLIKKESILKNSKILYVRGKNITMNFKEELKKMNFNIDQEIVYRQKELKIKKEIFYKIQNGNINSVAFFSSNAVKSFYKSVRKLPSNFTIFCFSESIANKFKKYYGAKDFNFFISKKPNIDDFCDLFLFNREIKF